MDQDAIWSPATGLGAGDKAGFSAVVSDGEWQHRVQLAACYRLFDSLGWTDTIFNHITLRLDEPGGAAPAASPAYLINPFGLHYSEVTPANLVKIDAAGNKLEPSRYNVNPAGFTIHSVIHSARADAHCVMHSHTTTGIAVASKQAGLRHDNFYSALLWGRVAYHAFEGITTNASEGPRLVDDLADKDVLILRNHGLLVVGRSVAHAFETIYALQRACDIQCLTEAMSGPSQEIPSSVLAAIPQQRAPLATDAPLGRMMFSAMVRKLGLPDSAMRYID